MLEELFEEQRKERLFHEYVNRYGASFILMMNLKDEFMKFAAKEVEKQKKKYDNGIPCVD